MYTKPKTKEEKEFLEQVIEFANETSWLGDIFHQHCHTYKNYEIHHCKGAQTKVKTTMGTLKIGEFFILPVPFELHNIKSNHPLNITNRKSAFESEFGTQKALWYNMITRMIDLGYKALPDHIVKAVMSV